MKTISTIILLSAALVAAGCSSSPGPDTIASQSPGGGPGGVTITTCTTICHVPGGTVGPDPFATGGSGTAGKHVAHVVSAGLPCGRCHSGYANNPNHMNGTLNIKAAGPAVFFNYLNTGAGWTYMAGPPEHGDCSNVACHVDNTGTPTTMNWYGADVPFTLPDCSICHSAPVGIRRQVFGAAGDFASNPSVTSHHVVGAGDPTTVQCKVCHDQYLHMTGTVRLWQADTTTGINYSPSAPSTLEPFCLSCHDANGANGNMSPFADGATLGTIPYVASTTVASSWSGASTHRSRGLTCAGTGQPNSGCHGTVSAATGTINMHGSTMPGLLANGMNFRIPVESQATYSAGRPSSASYDQNNYKLCFDCHANYPAVTKEVVFGALTGGIYDLFKSPAPFGTTRQQSQFRDQYVSNTSDPRFFYLYNDTMWGDPFLALHNYHLLGFESQFPIVSPGVNMLQWKYRGDPARIGRITCTACHDVHGAAVPTIRSTHEALGLTQFAGVGSDIYVSLGINLLPGDFMNAPMNCAIDCHGPAGLTSYWKIPGGE